MAPEANFYNRKEIVMKVGSTEWVLSLHDAYVLHEQLERALQDADYPPKG